MFTPEFRTTLAVTAAGVFVFVTGVSLTGSPYRTVGLAAALTGALLLAAAFPRLFRALPGLPTGRIAPPIEAASDLPDSDRELFGDLPGVEATEIPDAIELAARLDRLGEVVAEQSELFASALTQLRNDIARQ